jgi:arsenite methyltransferase
VRRELLELLADPVAGTPLTLETAEQHGGEIVSGTLVGRERYPVSGGIPRFVRTDDAGQRQTESSFAYKWLKRDSFGSEGMRAELHRWLLERYGFESRAAMRDYFASRRRVLDAGCGAGFATSAWLAPGWDERGAEWVGADISGAIDVAREQLGGLGSTHFVQADILALPFRPGTFDSIFSEGVLHHTPSTERALLALAALLAQDGDLLFYVYRRKAPLREFADDHVRERLAGSTPEEAWAQLRPLTRLGQALAELRAEVEVPEDVPLLGIRAGRYDVQRLIYWHMAKLFWNDELTFEENNHVNFDWYAPQYAHRQTEEQVRRWCAEAGLEITRFHADEAGFTVRARKPG